MAADLGVRMASATLSPTPSTGGRPAPIQDPVTFEEAALILKKTNQPEFAFTVKVVARKLRRWAKDDGLTVVAGVYGPVVSHSDLLQAHARRYPAPGRR